MDKFITKDKVAEFVMTLWDKGIKVDLDPVSNQLVIRKGGKYVWLPVYEEASYDELVASFTEESEEE